METGNQLAIIVDESGLEKSKAQVLLDNFSDYFRLAAEWESKARALVISDVSQKAEMKMAREGRLFLRQKRIEVEKTRKTLKEQSLREGKAIDGIANVLKAVIEPIESYLEEQEKFAERKEENRKAVLREERTTALTFYGADITALADLGEMTEEAYQNALGAATTVFLAKKETAEKAEEERLAREKAEADERERIRLENERLKEEAKEREKIAEAERKKQEAVQANIRAKAEAEKKAIEEKARKEKAEVEAKLRKERDEKAKLEAELKKKRDAEEAEKRAKAEEELKAKAAPDKEKLKAFSNFLQEIALPELQTEDGKKLLVTIRGRIDSLILFINSEVTK